MLPENTILGTLEYIEVYDFYDTPQFFSCKNQKEEIYLGLAVNSEPLTYLFALIEDSSILFSAKYRLINTPDFYLDLNYKIYKVILSGALHDVVTEIPQLEVESYFSGYIQKTKEKHEAFADFLKELHGELNND